MTQLSIETNIIDPSLFPQEQGPPHKVFDLWRENDPVHWNPINPDYNPTMPFSRMRKGFWVLTRYDDVWQVSMDQELFSSHEDGFVIWDLDEPMIEAHRANFMGMLPDKHKKVRLKMTPPFMPKNMNDFEPSVIKVAKDLIDEAAKQNNCEFVFDVASKLPIYTFCELMGIPEELREEVAHHGNGISDVETRANHSFDPMIALHQISTSLTEEKRANPDGMLMSTIVNDKELNLSQAEINEFFVVFAMAGHETTRSTSAHFLHLMEQNPDQFEILMSDFDAHIDNAINEVLRYTSTTTNFRRTAMADTEIGGYPVKKGDKIYLGYAAANRDPAVFENPHKFDITRHNASKHLAFGVGPHVCIGARLARMQLRAILSEIYKRFPNVEITGKAEWMASIWFNAIVNLPVRFSPAK